MQSFRTEIENPIVEKDILDLEKKIHAFKNNKIDEENFRSLLKFIKKIALQKRSPWIIGSPCLALLQSWAPLEIGDLTLKKTL